MRDSNPDSLSTMFDFNSGAFNRALPTLLLFKFTRNSPNSGKARELPVGYSLVMADHYTVDRDKLHAEVWAEPMTKVSKRYEISDVALAKVCRKLNIPVPERGYWASVAHGQRPRQWPLPPRSNDVQQQVEIHPIRSNLRQQLVEFPSILIDEIPVPESLTSPHRLIISLRKTLHKGKPDSYGRISSGVNDISVHVGPESVPRVLRIADAFAKAVEARGFTFVPQDPGRGQGLAISVNGQTLRICFWESSTRVTPPSPQIRSKSLYPFQEVIHAPSRKLAFRVREYALGRMETLWSDRAKEPLEKQIGNIVEGLVEMAQDLSERAERRAREEEIARERAEEHRQAEIQHKKFDEDVSNWSKAETIRLFLTQLEREMEVSPPKDLAYGQRWLEWAKDHAVRLDPFSEGTDAFLEHYLQFGWDKMSRRS